MTRKYLASALIICYLLTAVHVTVPRGQTSQRILHQPVTEAQEKQAIIISAEIEGSQAGVLMYIMLRRAGKQDYVSVPMSPVEEGMMQGEIPAKWVTTGGLDYYLRLQDPAGRMLARYPEDGSPVSIIVSSPQPKGEVVQEVPAEESAGTPVGIPPAPAPAVSTQTEPEPEPLTIVHQPMTEAVAQEPLNLEAGLTGPSPGALVYIMYRKTGEKDFHSASMTRDSQGVYSGQIPAKSVTTQGLEYFLRAVDPIGKDLARYPQDDSVVDLMPDPATVPAAVAEQLSVDEQSPPVAPEKPVIVMEEGKKKSGLKTWHWMGLGALAVAGIAVVAMSGGDGNGSDGRKPLSKLPDPPEHP
jgi:hypothetical protein